MNDFSGSHIKTAEVPFTFGSVKGVRAFNVAAGRTLMPVSAGGFKYNGKENVGDCIIFPSQLLKDRGLTGHSVAVFMDGTRRAHPHYVACSWCTCGFYAYYQPEYSSYTGYKTITGVIEGYGKVSYSNRGFRAEKCRIVAAVNPYLTTSRTSNWWRILVYRMFVKGRLIPVIPGYLVGFWSFDIGNLLLKSLVSPLTGHWYPESVYWYTMTLLFIWLALGIVMSFSRNGASLGHKISGVSTSAETKGVISAGIDPAVFMTLEQYYPDIQWYPSITEMLQEHPLSSYKDMPA